MKDWFKNNWYWVVGGIIALIILWSIYKAIKKSGAKAHQTKFTKDDTGDLTEEQIGNLKALAESIYNDIHCVWCSRDTALYTDLSTLGNNELIGISNMYNKMYEKDHDETLYQALDNEVYWGDTDGKVVAVMDRMRGLGIA